MEQSEFDRLSAEVDFAHMTDPRNVALLGHLSTCEREEFARRTGSLVLYFGAEVAACRQAEEAAALAAAPKPFELAELNGLNIGCGDRLISPYLTPVDIMRQPPGSAGVGGEHHALTPGALLALPDELPFRANSVDYIVALHCLEHIGDPIAVVRHWLDILKPGGGLGIVLPDWRYTWSAREDATPYGHKWNCTADLVRALYERHWADQCTLEALDTYAFRLSFDCVLRKHGAFQPFSRARLEAALSGRQLAEAGRFLELPQERHGSEHPVQEPA